MRIPLIAADTINKTGILGDHKNIAISFFYSSLAYNTFRHDLVCVALA